MNQSLLKGALIITVASILSKIIGSVFRIPLQNIAGDEVFGIFSIVYPVYMAVLILSVAGIPLAVSKLVSEAEAAGKRENIAYIFKTAGILALLFGLSSFLVISLLSPYLAELLGGGVMQPALIVVSATLLIAPYMAVYRGLYQGFGTMTPTAVSQIIEQIVRVGFILAVAYFLVQQGSQPAEVTAGVMAGSIVGAAGSLIYLRSVLSGTEVSVKGASPYSVRQFTCWSKVILKVSLPICFGALAISLIAFIDSITVPGMLRTTGHNELETATQFGYYSRGIALVQIVIVIAQALILPVVPKIAAALEAGERQSASRITGQALTITHFMIWPATVGLVVLSVPLNFALFGDTQQSDVMTVVHLSAGLMALSILTTGIIQGIGKAVTGAWIVAGAAVLKIVLNIGFVSAFGLIGVAWSTLITYGVLFVANTWYIYSEIPVRLSSKKIMGFASSALVMGVLIAIAMSFIDISGFDRIETVWFVSGAIAAGALLYGLVFLMQGAVTKDELKEFVKMKRL